MFDHFGVTFLLSQARHYIFSPQTLFFTLLFFSFSYVYDVVRSEIPKLTLDETFIMKDELSDKIKTLLGEMMTKFGYEIVGAPGKIKIFFYY